MESTDSIVFSLSSPSSVNSLGLVDDSTDPLDAFDMTTLRIARHNDFAQWLSAICVIGFDIERGQVVEQVFPYEDALSVEDQKAISYLAFPDHNAGCKGDTTFSFRYRSLPSRRFMHGFVCFRQVEDASSRRGYFQKSLVLITDSMYHALYLRMAAIIGSCLFDQGSDVLQQAYHDIKHWPAPTSGVVLSLPLLGSALEAVLTRDDGSHPLLTSLQIPDVQPSTLRCDLASFDISLLVQSLSAHLEHLWELVLVGDPVIISANSPADCSRAVLAATRLIYPISYEGDFRPYFTIHDPELKTLTNVGPDKKALSVLLGVTNPFFFQSLAHLPTFIRIGDAGLSRPSSSSALRQPALQAKIPPFKSEAVQDLERDVLLAKSLSKTDSLVAKVALFESHFSKLTEAFLNPLERYVTKLMPLRRTISPFKGVPKFPAFDPRDCLTFLFEIIKAAPAFCKGNLISLYSRFLKSSNFRAWLSARRRTANVELLRLFLVTVAETNFAQFHRKDHELETVDLLLRIRDAKSLAEHKELLSDELKAAIDEKIASIIMLLPEDLRKSIPKKK